MFTVSSNYISCKEEKKKTFSMKVTNLILSVAHCRVHPKLAKHATSSLEGCGFNSQLCHTEGYNEGGTLLSVALRWYTSYIPYLTDIKYIINIFFFYSQIRNILTLLNSAN